MKSWVFNEESHNLSVEGRNSNVKNDTQEVEE